MSEQHDQALNLLKLYPGAILLSQATPEELDALQARIDAKASGSGGKPPRRSIAQEQQLNAWADWLAPHFANEHSTHFTGTYSDEYGYQHGLMLVRNVLKDFQAFRRVLVRNCLDTRPGCIGVEYHPTTHRSILHLHALLGGEWDEGKRRLLCELWQEHRGWSTASPVTNREGCVRYAAKHLMKQGDTDAFDFWPGDEPYLRSRHARRVARGLS